MMAPRPLPVLCLAAIAWLVGCDRQADLPAPADAPATTPAGAGDTPTGPGETTVTLTSNIDGAEVWQGHTKLGTVPHDVSVNQSTSLSIRADGHTSKDVELLASGAPQVHVRLFPGVVGPEQPVVAANAIDHKPPSGDEQAPEPPADPPLDGPSGPNQPDPDPEPDAEPDPPAPDPDADNGKFRTFKEIDDAYANGEITKARKKKETSRLKFKRLKEIEELKKQVRNDELDEIEYGQKVRQLNIRYKG